MVEVQTLVTVDSNRVSMFEGVGQVTVFRAEQGDTAHTRVYVVPDVVLLQYLLGEN